MSNTNNSPNMNLPVPNPTVDPGPQYAVDLANCFAILDAHTHGAGSGVQITPSGMNINIDLPFNGNNAVSLRSARYTSQGSPLALASDLNCTYVSGVDLYYNDGNGNQVRITQSGGVAGSPGSISNLSSPASAAYVSANSTFVWQSAANTPANTDCASIILRNLTANSHGLTLNPPSAMAANYNLTLPSLPGSQSFLTLDASGNFATPIPYTAGITGANIAPVTVARSNLVGVGQQKSSSSGSFSTASASYVTVTNLTLSITTSGRPVMLFLSSDGVSTNGGSVIQVTSSGATGTAAFQILRGATPIYFTEILMGANNLLPASCILFLDAPAAGTYTYTVQTKLVAGSGVYVGFTVLNAYEL